MEIEMYHPETGKEVIVKRETQARALERSGWIRGKLPQAEVGDSTAAPSGDYGWSGTSGGEGS